MRKIFSAIILKLCILGVLIAQEAPPNIPAQISVENNQIQFRYNGKDIFSATIRSSESVKQFENVSEIEEAINQVIMLQGSGMTIEGEISGNEEAFPCEVDRRTSFSYDLVRHTVGKSTSLLNRAVYDRKYDWVLSIDEQGAKVQVIPIENNRFKIKITGNEICIRFRPLYYQKHRKLAYYKPWEFKVPEKPVVGWCSWFAFWNRVTENDIHRTADVLSEKLVPYGLEYLQIDDGYQQEPGGLPETWLNPNEKFPNGMDGLADYIKRKGMLPGVWTYASFHDKKSAEENKDLFVKDKSGNLAKGRWLDYCIDGSNPKAINKLIRPVYRGFTKMGWKYFKVDALRHLRYDGYNSFPEYFEKKGVSRVEAFRNFVQSIREEIGPDNYMLACWGVRPELIGITDACRIGTDGYGLGTLSQYNSFNNVIWQNDPDHIEAFGEFAYRDCMATSVTGSLYMITDKPEDYKTGNLEPIIRTIPVLRTMPGQIYDVDPSRSMYLDRVESETSGSGERIFDGGRTSFNDLFLLEINKPYENWMILGRTGNRIDSIEFNRLGLDSEKKYIVFDFWNKKLRGIYSEKFLPGDVDSKYKCQVFCIREKESHPQLIATNRHISCGALELENLLWENNCLQGVSQLVANDEYIIYVNEPKGFTLQDVECDNAEVISSELKNNVREIHLKSPLKCTAKWKINYKNK
ncbi:MAG: alpha-galactosidase [Bacteroidales bacterium]|nr:alpha-galactosidase [Bacteroidales bacterium]MBN2774139.1 alpha-galactosidase [Prolixibacteraceae bacterium]